MEDFSEYNDTNIKLNDENDDNNFEQDQDVFDIESYLSPNEISALENEEEEYNNNNNNNNKMPNKTKLNKLPIKEFDKLSYS